MLMRSFTSTITSTAKGREGVLTDGELPNLRSAFIAARRSRYAHTCSALMGKGILFSDQMQPPWASCWLKPSRSWTGTVTRLATLEMYEILQQISRRLHFDIEVISWGYICSSSVEVQQPQARNVQLIPASPCPPAFLSPPATVHSKPSRNMEDVMEIPSGTLYESLHKPCPTTEKESAYRG